MKESQNIMKMIVVHHCAKLNACRSGGSADITFIFCYVLSPHQMIKGICELLSGRPQPK